MASLRHAAAQLWSLVGLFEPIRIDAVGFENVQQLSDGLFGKRAGSAHDPGILHTEQTKSFRTRINKGVGVIVSRQNPVGTRRGI